MTAALSPRADPAWHTQAVAAVAQRLHTDPDAGLAEAEAAQRLEQVGPNMIPEHGGRGVFGMVAAQFTDFMILVLVAAAIVSGLIGDAEDTLVILAIVLLNAAIGLVQDFRAERAMAALRQLAAARAIVIRGGRQREIAAAELVPGDVVALEAGGAVPADLRLVEAPRLKITEAALTGEAVPVDKRTEPLADADLPLGDRIDMAFKGTIVTYGRGRGIVVATGLATELGHIAGMLEATPTALTPLQQRLARFGRQLALAILAICAIVLGFGLLRGEPVLVMLLTALSLAVAAIPEAMPAVVTVMLALGARRMARRNALVRRLPAVETLGSVACICTDKTGTLTRNEMRAEEVWVAGERRPAAGFDAGAVPARRLVAAIALCNDAASDADGNIVGDPTEAALLRLAVAAGFDPRQAAPRRLELPFDSDRKRMTTFHDDAGGFVAYTKGAPETVLARCPAVLSPHGETALEPAALLAVAEAMAADGLRVLAIACRHWQALPPGDDPEAVERELTLLGLVGLIDPPRPEAKDAVALCRSAGITPIMITGDHPVTARAIAAGLGMLGPGDLVLSGQELRRLSDAELAGRIAHLRVCARVDPAQKIRIVAAAQAAGQFVAMTGDGVNDAPALARADIGVAMGRSGTDVAREAASLVLLDDNFATIVAAVAEGRRIFDNIRKFVSYVLSCNAAEILTVFLAPFFGLPIPLLPIQILWINLVTDGLPGLALAAEPAETGLMQRPPRPPGESILAQGLWQHILWVGAMMALITLATQAVAIHVTAGHWQTLVFTVLTLAQMANALASRSESQSLLRQGLFSNRPLFGAVLLTFALQLATIYVPALNPVFHTAPLSPPELAACLALSALILVPIECEKWIKRRRAGR